MAERKGKTYWPHMILGFLVLGITLSYWTVKSASSMPVNKSNTFMMDYQSADTNINEIMESKVAFDKQYTIKLQGAEIIEVKDNVHSKLKNTNHVKLVSGSNTFYYDIMTQNGRAVEDANVTFVLTRPHTVQDDKTFLNIPLVDGEYKVSDVNISKPGRYTLQLRVKIGQLTGYSEIPAYLQQ